MKLDIDSFKQELNRKKIYIDDSMKEMLIAKDSYPPLIHEAMHYAVFNGGKRLRPIMLIESAGIAGRKAEEVLPAACAIEMIHSYSLVHDDLPAMDDDDFRRGKPTCHRVFGEANAILTGDALLTEAFGMLAKNAENSRISPDAVLRVLGELARAAGSMGMIGGQVLDLESENKKISYEELMTLHNLKTGELFRTSLRAGAILGGMNEKGVESLSTYAEHFGLAFQITDDILDVAGDEALLGKPIGSDEKNSKTTYCSIFGIEKARELAEESVQACIKSLEIFGCEADFLRQLAQFTLYRSN